MELSGTESLWYVCVYIYSHLARAHTMSIRTYINTVTWIPIRMKPNVNVRIGRTLRNEVSSTQCVYDRKRGTRLIILRVSSSSLSPPHHIHLHRCVVCKYLDAGVGLRIDLPEIRRIYSRHNFVRKREKTNGRWRRSSSPLLLNIKRKSSVLFIAVKTFVWMIINKYSLKNGLIREWSKFLLRYMLEVEC